LGDRLGTQRRDEDGRRTADTLHRVAGDGDEIQPAQVDTGAARRDRVALDPDAPVLPDIRGMVNAMCHAVDQVIYDLNITPDIVNVDAALSGRRPFVVDGDDVIRDMGLVGVDKQYAVPPDRDEDRKSVV